MKASLYVISNDFAAVDLRLFVSCLNWQSFVITELFTYVLGNMFVLYLVYMEGIGVEQIGLAVCQVK